jgi:hypothetical protein
VAVAVVCAGVLFQEYVSLPLPPLCVTVAVPLEPPLQDTGVDVADAVSTAGSVTVVDAVAEQPLLSVTVTEYDPAARPVAVAPVWLFDHRYVLPPLPPAGVTVAVPLLPPLQETGVDDADAVRTAGSVTVADAVAEQPLLSVTVTE